MGSLVCVAGVPFVFAEETSGFEDYEEDENIIKVNNTLNEFSTVLGKEEIEKEEIWDGSSFFNEYTKYEELEEQRKKDEYYEKIRKMFEDSAFDFDLEKFKETGNLEDCLSFNANKAIKAMKDNAELFKKLKKELENLLKNIVDNGDFIELITSIFSDETDKGGE